MADRHAAPRVLATRPLRSARPSFPALHTHTDEQSRSASADGLWNWFQPKGPRGSSATLGFDLLKQLLTYDPTKRITARAALTHKWWLENPQPHAKFVPPLLSSTPSLLISTQLTSSHSAPSSVSLLASPTPSAA